MARKSKQEEVKASSGSHLDRILSNKKYDSMRQAEVDFEADLLNVSIISTGSLIFDIFLGGGYRPGISRMIAEPEHGKTAQLLVWIRNWLNTVANSMAIHFDAEGRITKELIQAAGLVEFVKTGRFKIFRINIYEDIAQMVNDLILDNPEDIKYFFGVDSADALITRADVEKSFDESATVAGGARMASAFNKRVSVHLGHRGHHLQILSQTRANMNSRGPGSGGTTESGGKALAFFSSLTAKVDKLWSGLMFFRNKDDETPIGHYFSLKLIKNFTDKKQYKIQIPILYGKGVWLEKEIFDLAVSYSLVSRSGAWYTVEEELQNLGLPEKINGENKFIDFLTENPEVTKKIEEYFRSTLIPHEV